MRNCQLPISKCQLGRAVCHPERSGAKRNGVEESQRVSVNLRPQEVRFIASFTESQRDPSTALRSLRSLHFARDDGGDAL